MDKLIRYSYLNKPELEYEVTIRAENPAENLTSLRDQMTKLRHVLPEDIKSSPIPLHLDLSQAESTLNYIDGKISHVESSGDRSNIKKVESFMNHLYYRLERISAVPPLIELCSSVRSRFFLLQKRFEALGLDHIETEEDVSEEIHNHPTQNQSDLAVKNQSDPPTQNQAIPLFSPRISEPSEVLATSQQVPYPAAVWGMPQSSSMGQNCYSPCNFVKDFKRFSYDGKTCPRSFLQKLEEFQISRNISEVTLVKHAFEIFVGDALHWFRFQHIRNPSLTWSQIHVMLIKDFGIQDYDYKLLEAIRNRTQGATETIIVYVSIMFGMFNRLSKKLIESDQLEILLHNIRPCYSVFVALKDINSIDSLVSTCQSYEKISERDLNFREPRYSDTPSCAAEFAYRPATSKNNSNLSHSNAIQNKQSPSSSQTENKPKEDYCWRCRVTGHTLKTCTQPRYLICFKCGLKGVKISNCPKCTPVPQTKN